MVGLRALAAIFPAMKLATGRGTARRENDSPRFSRPEHFGQSNFAGHEYQDPNPI